MKTPRLTGLLLFISMVAAVPFLNTAKASSPAKEITSTILFKQGDNGYRCFRIPAIIRTQKGALLAFAEARKNSCSDTGKIDLVVRRSDNNGKSWGEMQVVWSNGNNVCGNPAPVVDRNSGRIILLSTGNLGSDTEKQIISGKSKDTRRVYSLYSDDEGFSWSSPQEITQHVKLPDWSWYATGPCHAVQLNKKPYKDRIVIPSNHNEGGNTYSQIIYSDDAGKSWHLGGIVAKAGGNESTVAELENGDLLLNMRTVNRKESKSRAVAVSRNGGISWSEMQYADALIEPVCQGSILNYNRKGKPSRTLLFSNPSSETKRENMTIKISRDNGNTWKESIPVYAGPSAYSDMSVLRNGDVAILYECGEKSPYETIRFAIIPAKQLK